MAATDARPVPKKNVAYRHYFAIRKNDGTLITSWAGQDSEVDKDGAGFSDCTNEATEIGTTGVGYLDLTSTEMNADAVNVKITVTNTSALPYVVTLFPEEAGDVRVDVTQIEGADPTDQIRDAVVDDATRIDASALNTLSSHDPGEAIMGATDLGTGSGLTSLATAAELDKVPKSDSNVTWNATAAAQIQSEATDALNAYDPPTNAEMASALSSADDATLAAIASLNNISSAGVTTAVVTALTTALTEGYRSTGSTGSVRDLLYELIAHLGEHVISGTTKTTKRLDGSTTAKTYTLNDATTPTGITEAT